jgi:hypothetical protein
MSSAAVVKRKMVLVDLDMKGLLLADIDESNPSSPPGLSGRRGG